MKVRVYTDYEPVRILRGVSKKDFTEPTDALAQKCGLTGTFIEIDDSQIPKTRENRFAWKVANGKIDVDSIKVQRNLEKESEKSSKRASILSKLNITESELAEIIK